MGYLDTRIVPVFDSRTLTNLSETFPVGGESLTKELKLLLKENALLLKEGQESALTEEWLESVPLKTWENLKAQLLIVRVVNNQDQETEGMISYSMQDQTSLLIPHHLRTEVCESLFRLDADDASIVTLICNVIKKV